MSKGGGGDGGAAARAAAEEQRKAGLRANINAMFDDPGSMAQFGEEERQLGDSLRGYYTDQLGRKYQDAERRLRFAGADTGNIGGSQYAEGLRRIEEERDMGATTIEDTVRNALAGLRSQREDARTRGLSLVNSGSGEDAVMATSSALRGALDAARSAQRQDLFANSFNELAFGKALSDAASRNDKALALFGQKRGLSPTAIVAQPRVVQ